MNRLVVSLLGTRYVTLLALLLVLLLSLGNLTAHAGADACTADCASHMETMDTDEGCAACAAIAASAHLASGSPEPPALAPLMSVDVYTPRPPRRPPKA